MVDFESLPVIRVADAKRLTKDLKLEGINFLELSRPRSGAPTLLRATVCKALSRCLPSVHELVRPNWQARPVWSAIGGFSFSPLHIRQITWENQALSGSVTGRVVSPNVHFIDVNTDGSTIFIWKDYALLPAPSDPSAGALEYRIYDQCWILSAFGPGLEKVSIKGC